jgi:hypothetical protein
VVSKETVKITEFLTARNHDPDEVHEKEVEPEIICFWPAICQILVVVIEHAGCIVKNIAIYLAQRHQSLKRVS